jgi:hypothetical protein
MNASSLKLPIFVLMVITLWTVYPQVLPASEEKQAITGHIYCVVPTAEGVRLEPGVCPGGDHPHVVKTQNGQLVLLQESPLLKDIPKLTSEQKKNVEIEGRFVGKTTFSPESVKWPWLR